MTETILSNLVDKSNRILRVFTHANILPRKNSNTFCMGNKSYLLSKIYEQLYNVSGRSMISNCESPTEKASKFLDFHLKSLMQSGWSCIWDSGNFILKIKRITDMV